MAHGQDSVGDAWHTANVLCEVFGEVGVELVEQALPPVLDGLGLGRVEHDRPPLRAQCVAHRAEPLDETRPVAVPVLLH